MINAGLSHIHYPRIMVKFSGEALAGSVGYGLDQSVLKHIAHEVHSVYDRGVEVAIVVGGGNIVRGATATETGLDRPQADYMGMLATVINSIALQNILEHEGVVTRVQTAFPMPAVAEPYILRRALRHLEKNRVVILAAGTGDPYFTTDTAAALRALELNCTVLLKGTKVDGVYSADPKKDPEARKYAELTYSEAINRELQVMDRTALTMCQDHNLPIIVYNLMEAGSLERIVFGGSHGTIVHSMPHSKEGYRWS